MPTVTYPFDFKQKSGMSNKITKEEEIEIWQNIQDFINDLISRCNTLNSSSIAEISLVHQDNKPGPLSQLEYDSNIDSIESKLNTIIQASVVQGLNASNPVSLIKRGGDSNLPLLIWQRDTNLKTIKTVINTINTLYVWAA